jgi:hypothetical protein
MKHQIKHTFSIWIPNSLPLMTASIAAMVLPIILSSYLSFNYIPFDYILQTVLIGGVYSYINDYQLSGTKKWQSYFKSSNVFLSFILLAVTYILFQKLFNRVVSSYISTDVFIEFVNNKGWLVRTALNNTSLLSYLITSLSLFMILPLLLTPAVLVGEQVNFTQALAKSTLMVFKHFWLVISVFVFFEIAYFGINEIFHDMIKKITIGLLLSLQISFYYSIYYLDKKGTIDKEENEILQNFGTKI